MCIHRLVVMKKPKVFGGFQWLKIIPKCFVFFYSAQTRKIIASIKLVTKKCSHDLWLYENCTATIKSDLIKIAGPIKVHFMQCICQLIESYDAHSFEYFQFFTFLVFTPCFCQGATTQNLKGRMLKIFKDSKSLGIYKFRRIIWRF